MKIGKFSPNVAKAGDDQAFWKRRGARAVPARLSSAALREFAQDPTLQVVEARGHEPPRNAVVHYRSDDPDDGPITRYTIITRKLKLNDADHYARHAAMFETPLAF